MSLTCDFFNYPCCLIYYELIKSLNDENNFSKSSEEVQRKVESTTEVDTNTKAENSIKNKRFY